MPLKYIILVGKKEHACNREGEEATPGLRARASRAVEGTRPEAPTVLWFTASKDSTAGGKIWVRDLSNIGKAQSPAWR